MTHIFRKYGKAIMTVFSCVLMLTFAVNSLSKGGGRSMQDTVKGTLDGKKVTVADLNRASLDLDVLQNLLRLSDSPRDPRYGIPDNDLGAALFTLSNMLDPHEKYLHMYLLLTEAEKYGFIIPTDEVDHILQDAKVEGTDNPENGGTKYAKFLSDSNIGDYVVRRAITDVLSIFKLRSSAEETLPVSVPELQHLAVDTSATMQVRYLVLDTKNADAEKKDYKPAVADQEKQFAAYKGVLPLDPEDTTTQPPLIGGHHYPFGYKYPDRIKLEVLTFDRQQIRDSIVATVDDVTQAYKDYQQNPDQYQTKPLETKPSTQLGPTALPTTRPFDDVRGDIIKKILDKRTEEKMRQMLDFANAKLKTVWDKYQSTMDAKGFYAVAADQWPSYETLAGDVEKQFHVRPKLEAYGKNWMSRKAAAENLKERHWRGLLFSVQQPPYRLQLFVYQQFSGPGDERA